MGSEELSPEAAARVLADLPHYEEALTAKAFGITVMAFGIASAAIGMTYHISIPLVLGQNAPWVFSFLWVPWIAAAAVLTVTVWRSQSISLGTDGDAGTSTSWWYVVAFSASYMVLFMLANVVRAQTTWMAPDGVLNLYVLAVFTAGLGAFFGWRYDASALSRPLFFVAVLILGAAGMGDYASLGSAAATLYGAGVTLVSYVGAGIVIARRG